MHKAPGLIPITTSRGENEINTDHVFDLSINERLKDNIRNHPKDCYSSARIGFLASPGLSLSRESQEQR